MIPYSFHPSPEPKLPRVCVHYSHYTTKLSTIFPLSYIVFVHRIRTSYVDCGCGCGCGMEIFIFPYILYLLYISLYSHIKASMHVLSAMYVFWDLELLRLGSAVSQPQQTVFLTHRQKANEKGIPYSLWRQTRANKCVLGSLHSHITITVIKYI